jgi:hypothetical protein
LVAQLNIFLEYFRYFVDQKPIWEQDSGLIIPGRNLEVDSSVAQYTGGLMQVKYQILNLISTTSFYHVSINDGIVMSSKFYICSVYAF